MQLIYLPLEILIKITEFLPTKSILNLSICSKHCHSILFFIKFNEKVNFENISRLPYFDSFTNVKYYRFEKYFPKSLQILYWCCDDSPSQLPDSLISLYLGGNYNHPLPQLPNSLENLGLGYIHNHPLPQLPNSLKNLNLSWYYNHPLTQLPNSLKNLDLGYYYNHSLPQLPNSLESLHLSWRYNRLLPQLPDSLKFLKVWRDFPLPALSSNVNIRFFD